VSASIGCTDIRRHSTALPADTRRRRPAWIQRATDAPAVLL